MMPFDPAAVAPGQDPTSGLPPMAEGMAPGLEPSPEPLDPISELLALDPQEAIRRVYSLSASAARAKARIEAAADRLDARGYHAAMSANPEARYAGELLAARRRLDTLAQERRRLGLEIVKQADGKPRSGVLDAHYAGTTMAMEQVALGTLLFLAMPAPDALDQLDPIARPAPPMMSQTPVQPTPPEGA